MQRDARAWILENGTEAAIQRLKARARAVVAANEGKRLGPRARLLLRVNKAFLADLEKTNAAEPETLTLEQKAKTDEVLAKRAAGDPLFDGLMAQIEANKRTMPSAQWVRQQLKHASPAPTRPVPSVAVEPEPRRVEPVPEKHIKRLTYAERSEAHQEHGRDLIRRYGGDKRPISYRR